MPSSIDDTELARLEKELLDIPVDSVQKSGADDPEEDKERVKGRRRGKRRREESSSSESSSDSYSTESESKTDSSSGTVSSEDQPDIRKRRAEPLKKKYDPISPLELSRLIPRKIDFAGSVKEAPEIVNMEYKKLKKLRTRVDIDQPLLEHFDKCAAGVYVGTEERLNFFDRLPLVSSGLAAPPVLDEDLPRESFRIQVDEPSLMADAEVLLNGLNLMAIARSEGRTGRQEKADLYIEQAMEIFRSGTTRNRPQFPSLPGRRTRPFSRPSMERSMPGFDGSQTNDRDSGKIPVQKAD
ncbi:hypothetical protein ANCCAN_20183 [Ancylostoma caninum]|uniref:Uncharacterized protein n=1 Tax=Ancylostoma caninum TaxID=29170 RepID=A0A368FT52_ANCCA|nr:hypothetical protein ANCCAN_20183 [Ancylostoma caninum]